MFVPAGTKLHVSTTGEFDADDYPGSLNRGLDKGVRKFQFLAETDDEDGFYDEENGVPLGTIENLNEDVSAPTFLGWYDTTDSRSADYTDQIENEGCTENIYENTE